MAEFIPRFEGKAIGLKDAITGSGDPDAPAIAVHTLKGGARTFGLVRLAALARDIERATKADPGEDTEAAKQALDRHFAESPDSLKTYAQDL